MFYQKNEKLISVSFTAVIQTLRANPQMGSLIYSIPSANNSQQDKDNSNNITKCLESNKDSIWGLAEKNYQNLIEALTNNSIDAAANAYSCSFNFILQLPSSYCHLLNLTNYWCC
jgi:ABC-type phosphate/phosphonate transport system substrate-binding protein